ncbi:trihelix transcription factor GTL1 isoform X2 [Brachypodium distachyon]|uniref:Myb-like domain-containing protein n=1 Tax=Brachypodium distachyon TaxID=15368 RepID=A0A0Q3LYP6_BRADI|nr:trihelix transcription factor GTL1 isoform X2 [Brachypodium distachyon]KQJ97389.1 hypothetical protein BRADI_3g30457v3 [Brachypodium distachyon]|eukprot:XP_014756577.1 trihelix transcription factor GTL1 isoform X2 [Brachypodium distachyon]
MQQQQGGGGGPGQQFGLHPPEMPPFSPAGQRISMAEAPSPISSRPPAPPGQQQLSSNELAGAAAAMSFDEEALAAGEEGGGGGSGGNRWPRQETLVLLKIRSDMDAAFRDATLKGPLWEEVSRKLAEEGYRRNAKKCKEKFENVHKYYKRTKDSRAGRNDGKTYRFFQQLEALQGATPGAGASSVPPPATAVRAPAEPPPQPVVAGAMPTPMGVGNLSFSTSNTEEFSEDEDEEDDSDDEGTDDMAVVGNKRKRMSSDGVAAAGGHNNKKMMRFFEGLMRQVMERQEAMQQRFLEAIEKREQDRMIREEAWRRQEMARLAREQETLAQERAMAASRDAAVLGFIQKITGQSVPMPMAPPPPSIAFMPPPPAGSHPTPISFSAAPPSSSQSPATQASPRPQKPPMPLPTPAPQKTPVPATPPPQQQSGGMEMVVSAPAGGELQLHDGGSGSASSSRWPKAEVHALIQLRSNLDTRYQEAGPKGPLWEEISAGMRRMGYSRSSKRCKEKWENINKYFKKVKESNKKRPEDSKTCPYFHQLEALYRNKQQAALTSPSAAAAPLPALAAPPPPEPFTVAAPISQTPPTTTHALQQPAAAKNGAGNGHGNGNGSGVAACSEGGSVSAGGMQASNGFFGEAGVAAKKKA